MLLCRGGNLISQPAVIVPLVYNRCAQSLPNEYNSEMSIINISLQGGNLSDMFDEIEVLV